MGEAIVATAGDRDSQRQQQALGIAVQVSQRSISSSGWRLMYLDLLLAF